LPHQKASLSVKHPVEANCPEVDLGERKGEKSEVDNLPEHKGL
jgi:hypothetical protein